MSIEKLLVAAIVLCLFVVPGDQLAAADPESTPSQSADVEAAAALKKLGGKFLAEGFKSSWSPDGKQIVFGRGMHGIHILDLNTGKTTQIAKKGKDPAWSPVRRCPTQ